MARLTEYIPAGLYSARQAAELLNLSVRTIRERLASGELERLPLGPRQIRISSRSLNAMIAQRLAADRAHKRKEPTPESV
tara:strand:- start:172 stop:411 length:240 start_codon:yes stop_codon:yes gene_type:complete